MSAYIRCPQCEGNCLDVDTLMCGSDDGLCRYGHPDDQANKTVPTPIGKCPRCGTPYYVLDGYCGGCRP